MTSRIAIIGVGTVGAATAFALTLGSVCSELLLVDVKVDFRDGQVRDLTDATYRENSSTRVRAGTYKEAGQCDIVVITTGTKHPRGETRLDLLYRNISILDAVINSMKPFRPDTILLVISNPVDLLTFFAREFSRLPDTQIIGSGTFLDTVRLRGLLADRAGIAAGSIEAYVLGEHGDSQFVAWSCASIGGAPIDKVLPPDILNRCKLAEECTHEAQRTIEAKGAIAYGIASVVSSLCSSILLDKRNVYPVSHFQPDIGCCLSLPAVLGTKGVIKTIPPLLDSAEKKQLEHSAKKLKDAIRGLRDDA